VPPYKNLTIILFLNLDIFMIESSKT
jgi:hypothetical protein